ncbi:MAG: hypothetical protein KJ624_04725 [Chloroflexi bacterium]|nr:hypothetical protein [Chloroflexota bacterium]
MNGRLAEKIQEFSSTFDAARRVWDRRAGLTIDYQALGSKPFDAMMFFTMYAHERPFSNPRYPVAHRIAILKSIGASDTRDPGVNAKFANKYDEPGFPQAVWSDFKRLLGVANRDEETRERMEKYTKGPVYAILEKLRDEEEPNVVTFLTSMTLRDAYEFLKRIDGIGHKIAALFLRDARSYFGGWHNAENSDLCCVQPVDRWVRELAKKCWSNVNTSQDAEKIAGEIVRHCLEQEIDPIAFNKGAWLLGAHFQKLCGFFNIETTMRLSDTGTLNYEAMDRFAPSVLRKAIEALGKAEDTGEVYPL